jgi:hypothetical protein
MNLEENIRKIVADELDKRQQQVEFIPVADFCKSRKISRITIWRAEKEGKIKLSRIGKKIFINPNQFAL